MYPLKAPSQTNQLDSIPAANQHADFDVTTSPAGDSGALLGLSAESSSTPDCTDANEAFKARYRRLRVARKLLPDERIEQCLCTVAPKAKYVRAQLLNGEKKASRYIQLVRCESYACPVCAYGRAQRDRDKFTVMLSQAEKRGLSTVMISLTMRHHQGDSLDTLLDAQLKAWDAMWSDRWYADLVGKYGIVSKVRILEHTFGEHGHHPHIHSPMMMTEKLREKACYCPECDSEDIAISGTWAKCQKCGLQGTTVELAHSTRPVFGQAKTVAEFESEIRERWLKTLAKLGFDASWDHGLTVEIANSQVAGYLTKWGLETAAEMEHLIDGKWGVEAELALLPTKNQTKGGLTPFGLLAAAAGEEWAITRLGELTGLTDRDALIKRAGRLYSEYFYAFKNVARIYIPPKLSKFLDLKAALKQWNELHPPETNWIDMLLIERGDDWNAVWKRSLEADLLIAVRAGNVDHLIAWMLEHGIQGIIPDEAREQLDPASSVASADSCDLPVDASTDPRVIRVNLSQYDMKPRSRPSSPIVDRAVVRAGPQPVDQLVLSLFGP